LTNHIYQPAVKAGINRVGRRVVVDGIGNKGSTENNRRRRVAGLARVRMEPRYSNQVGFFHSKMAALLVLRARLVAVTTSIG
jgi:hypothetical protein